MCRFIQYIVLYASFCAPYIVVIPKSTHKERMAENFDVFSFELSEQDMNEIAKLDKAQSLFFSHYDPELIRFILSLEKNR